MEIAREKHGKVYDALDSIRANLRDNIYIRSDDPKQYERRMDDDVSLYIERKGYCKYIIGHNNIAIRALTDKGIDVLATGNYTNYLENITKKEKIENELKTHQIKTLKPYRFWLPFVLSIVGLSLGSWQTYRNYTLKEDLKTTNSAISTLTTSYDSLKGQLQILNHKLQQRDSLKR